MQGKQLSGPFSLFIPRIFGWLIDCTTLQNNIPLVQYVLHFVTLNFKPRYFKPFTSDLVLQKHQGPSTETIWYPLIYTFWGNERLECLWSSIYILTQLVTSNIVFSSQCTYNHIWSVYGVYMTHWLMFGSFLVPASGNASLIWIVGLYEKHFISGLCEHYLWTLNRPTMTK